MLPSCNQLLGRRYLSPCTVKRCRTRLQGKVKCVNPASGPLLASPVTAWLPDVAQLACCHGRAGGSIIGNGRGTAFQRESHLAVAGNDGRAAATSSFMLGSPSPSQPVSPIARARQLPELISSEDVWTCPSQLLLQPRADGPGVVVVLAPGGMRTRQSAVLDGHPPRAAENGSDSGTTHL